MRQLLRRGGDVVVLDNLSHGTPEAVGDARLVVGDVGDAELLGRLFGDEEITSVIHLAADKSVERVAPGPRRLLPQQRDQPLTLLAACRDAGVTDFVFSSTVRGVRDPRGAAGVRDDAGRAPRPRMGRASSWSSGCSTGSRALTGCGRSSLRYFNAAGAAEEGDIGEDSDRCAEPDPPRHEGDAREVPRPSRCSAPTTRRLTEPPSATTSTSSISPMSTSRALDYLADGNRSEVLNVGTGRAHRSGR